MRKVVSVLMTSCGLLIAGILGIVFFEEIKIQVQALTQPELIDPVGSTSIDEALLTIELGQVTPKDASTSAIPLLVKIPDENILGIQVVGQFTDTIPQNLRYTSYQIPGLNLISADSDELRATGLFELALLEETPQSGFISPSEYLFLGEFEFTTPDSGTVSFTFDDNLTKIITADTYQDIAKHLERYDYSFVSEPTPLPSPSPEPSTTPTPLPTVSPTITPTPIATPDTESTLAAQLEVLEAQFAQLESRTSLIEQFLSVFGFGSQPEPEDPPQTYQGLTGKYYDGISFNQLNTTRIDPLLNFNWTQETPAYGARYTNFSAKWEGTITLPYDGSYRFQTRTHDGVRVWINNQRIINDWKTHQSTTTNRGNIQLPAGNYPIKIEYFDTSGDAVMKLYWRHADISQQIVPAQYLSTYN